MPTRGQCKAEDLKRLRSYSRDTLAEYAVAAGAGLPCGTVLWSLLDAIAKRNACAAWKAADAKVKAARKGLSPKLRNKVRARTRLTLREEERVKRAVTALRTREAVERRMKRLGMFGAECLTGTDTTMPAKAAKPQSGSARANG